MGEEAKDWTPTPGRTREVLDLIEERQAELYPVCPCGQRTKNLDGICSKKTDEHTRLVTESRWK